MDIDEIRTKGKTPKKTQLHKYGNFLRPFAPYATKGFMALNISPNVASMASILLGVAGSACFVWGTSEAMVVGLVVHHVSYFFDIIDGQVARLQKRSNVNGAYLDAINHYFNIPLIFLGLGFGLYRQTGDLRHAALGVLASLFCRGSAKYCVAHSVLTTFHRRRISENDPLYLTKEAPLGPSTRGLVGHFRSLFIFPNILGILLVFAVCDVITSAGTLEILLLGYGIAYPLLDVADMTLHFKRGTADQTYLAINDEKI